MTSPVPPRWLALSEEQCRAYLDGRPLGLDHRSERDLAAAFTAWRALGDAPWPAMEAAQMRRASLEIQGGPTPPRRRGHA